MMQASVTKLAIKYKPPTFMIEYNNPQENEIYHRKISIDIQNNDSTSLSSTIKAEALVNKIISSHCDLLGNYGVLFDKSLLLCKNLLLNYEEHLLEQHEKGENLSCDFNKEEKQNEDFLLDQHEKEDTLLSINKEIKQKKENKGCMDNDGLKINENASIDLLQQINTKKNELVKKNDAANVNYGDLNKASLKELAEAKRNMNVTFESSCFKPGDDGYEYDKREAFDNVGLDETSWDSSSQ